MKHHCRSHKTTRGTTRQYGYGAFITAIRNGDVQGILRCVRHNKFISRLLRKLSRQDIEDAIQEMQLWRLSQKDCRTTDINTTSKIGNILAKQRVKNKNRIKVETVGYFVRVNVLRCNRLGKHDTGSIEHYLSRLPKKMAASVRFMLNISGDADHKTNNRSRLNQIWTQAMFRLRAIMEPPHTTVSQKPVGISSGFCIRQEVRGVYNAYGPNLSLD